MSDGRQKALDIAVRYSSIDGEHHKAWIIDQMVRALTDCPMVPVQSVDINGNVYSWEEQGESDKYKQIIADACDGEEGLHTYSWDVGIAP